jgi:hypothetical protein
MENPMAIPSPNEPLSMPEKTSSPNATHDLQRLRREKLASKRATLLLGCYRRSDAIDPEIYIRAIACILASYDDWVIVEATHPATGIQATEKFKAWPPNSGELKQFCADMATRAARYAVYDKLPRPDLTPRLPPQPDRRAGRCATLFVPESAPHYAAMVERSKAGDPKDWCWFADHPKYGAGIKVPFEWYPRRGGTLAPIFRQTAPTDEELRAYYAPQARKAG